MTALHPRTAATGGSGLAGSRPDASVPAHYARQTPMSDPGRHVALAAALPADPDAGFGELNALYRTDQRLRVPKTVFNALRERDEEVLSAA